MKTFRAIIENPFLNLLVSVVLLTTSLREAWDTLFEDLTNQNFQAHHGLIIFALLNILKTLPDLLEGIEHFVKSREDSESTG